MSLRRILILFLIIIFSWTSPAYSKDPSEEEIEKLIRDEKSELKNLRKKIKKQAGEIFTMGKKESKILRTLETLENNKQVRERE